MIAASRLTPFTQRLFSRRHQVSQTLQQGECLELEAPESFSSSESRAHLAPNERNRRICWRSGGFPFLFHNLPAYFGCERGVFFGSCLPDPRRIQQVAGPPPSLHPHKKGGRVVTPHNGRSTARAGQAVAPSTARAGRVPHTVPWMLSGEACKRRLGAEGSFGRGGQRRHPPCSLWVCRLRWPLFLRHRPRPIPLQLQPDRGAPSPRQDGLGPAYRAPNPAESREDQARLAAGAH